MSSPDIDYQLGGTNQLTFDGLVTGEKRSVHPIYAVVRTDTASSNVLTSQVLITQDRTTITVTRTFPITRRVLPLRQFWIPLSSGVCGS
jgi:hypothetical protein